MHKCPGCGLVVEPRELAAPAAKRRTAATFVGAGPRDVTSGQYAFHPGCFDDANPKEWMRLGPDVRAAFIADE